MTYQFGPFRYDAEQRLLFREGEIVPLAPKAIDTLHVLLERRGRIVEKSELMRLVWPDTNVEDVGLARNISLLRKALEDESEENPYIETIPRRGYRFAAQVSTTEQAETLARKRPRRSRRGWLIAVAVCLAVVGAFVYWQFYVPSRFLPTEGTFASLAVAPFECLCPGVDGAALSQGFNEVLVSDLSKLNGVHVVSPGTVQRYQRAGISMPMMGRILGVEVLVEGTIQQMGERLRILVRLVDVHSGKLVWAETYEEEASDPGAAQRAIARAVVPEVGKRLAGERSH
jgi:DNA-binding winged helix-turn-helix (wHTH) protein/TolB-like protein